MEQVDHVIKDKVLNTEDIDGVVYTGQNLIGVLFVLALVYIGILLVALKRTYRFMFYQTKSTTEKKVFAWFYSLVWISLFLTMSLYTVMTGKFFNSYTQILLFGGFYFFPLILMVNCYMLLYQQLELLMVHSRLK